MKATRSRWLRRCPGTGKLVPARLQRGWQVVLFPLAGLVSLIWFLMRVVPKPSRASYPCQRVAAPLASSFVLWLLGVSSAALVFRRARERFYRARGLVGVVCVLGGMAGLAWALFFLDQPVRAVYPPHPANDPIGTARGLAPGRVVWVHDPEVTDWPGPGTGEHWYNHVDQAVADRMVSGAGSDAEAWAAIFGYFNEGTGYTPGEKVVIKINLTTANARGSMADENYNQLAIGDVTLDSTANSPQLLHALLDQLVNVVGVAQADITIGDPTGLFVNYLYDPLHADFPDVHYWDNRGTLGRTRAEFGSVPLYWSTSAADGTTQDYLPLAFEQAAYHINFAVLKSHSCGGITVNAKNHYGSLLRCPDGFLRDAANTDPAPYNGYYNTHDTLPGGSCSSDPAMQTMGQYRALVDLMGHEGLGGKTVLYLVDGLFGGYDWYSAPSRWAMPPFDDDWPSSLFLSMDPVAIDSVARDFLSQQWPDQVLMYEGVEDYLHEAALADAPPSGTLYDPEGDGTPLSSLGVHEHWNNPVDKQYSRNLGTGDGIELVSPADTPEPVADLFLYKAVAPSGVISPGTAITFTLAYGNAGQAAAAGVVVTDVVPAGLTGVAYASSRPVTPTGPLSYTWSVGVLSPTQGGIITLTGVISPGLPLGHILTNVAQITATTEEGNPADNYDTVTVPVNIVEMAVYLPLTLRQFP
jgi:uncharacterized repeat protein (TIGR01451 family)